MIIVGSTVGFVFATMALVTGVISFPMLVDRKVGVPVAVATSIKFARKNIRITALWGMIVASLLFLGSVPMFIGLIFVLPVLGHGTWHLYRLAVPES